MAAPLIPKCGVCEHINRLKIEQALVLGAGSLRQLARQWAVSKDILNRHRRQHMAGALARTSEALAKSSGDSLAAEIRALIDEAHRLRAVAEGQKDIRVALKGLDTALRGLELFGKATGELQPHGSNVTINVAVTPAEGIREATELLMLLLDHKGKRRLIAQLQAQIVEPESLLLEGGNGQNPARPVDESLASKHLEVSST